LDELLLSGVCAVAASLIMRFPYGHPEVLAAISLISDLALQE
jgi:hypothetical protein